MRTISPPSGSVGTCVATLLELLDDVAALTGDPTDPAGAVALLDGMLTVSSRAQALVAALVGRIDDDGTWRESGFGAVRPWLTERTTLGSPAVSRLVEQSSADITCPLMTAAWRDGRVTWEHIRVIRDAHRRFPRLAHALRDCEGLLVDAAERVDPATLSEELFDLLHRLDPDHVISREHDRSLDAAFRASTLLDGWVKVDGLLPPVVGQALCAALAAARRRSSTDPEAGGAGPGGGDASSGDAGRGDAGRGDAGRGDADPDITARVRASRRNVDALAVILASAASAQGPDRLPSVHGARPVVHVHVSAESISDGTAPGWLETATGGRLVPVTAAAAVRLSCDAVRRVLVTSADGSVDAISILNRTVPGMMRRVIHERDGGVCRFPGCSHPIHEVHHVVPWSQGGPTVSSNLIGLCFFHHHLIHDGGWTAAGDANRVLTIRSPRGRQWHSPIPSGRRRC